MRKADAVKARIKQWIATGMLKADERLPSVRDMARKLQMSSVTVHQAYSELEQEGIISVRPRSGFRVNSQVKRLREFSSSNALDEVMLAPPTNLQMEAEFCASYSVRTNIDTLGSAYASDDLLPTDDLYQQMSRLLRWEAKNREPLPWLGASSLIETITRRYNLTGVSRETHNLITTTALEVAVLMVIDRIMGPDDTVLIESPSDMSVIAPIRSTKVRFMEIYSHPKQGLDIDQLRRIFKENRIRMFVVSTHKNAATGMVYSRHDLQRIVEAATEHNVIILQNATGRFLTDEPDIFDLADFDVKDLVISMGGFADFLGPYFGIAWVCAPKRWHIKPRTQNMPRAGEWARQSAVGAYIGGRSFDRQMSELRAKIALRVQHGLALMYSHFPDDCVVARPSSGYNCWVRAPGFDTIRSFAAAAARGVSFSPGPLFSASYSFRDHFRINLSRQWTSKDEAEIAILGEFLAASNV